MFIKRSLQIGLALLAASQILTAYAIGNGGFYMGFQAGLAKNKASPTMVIAASPPASFNESIKATPKKDQYGARLFMGYQFSPYAGLEGGFTYITPLRFKTTTPAALGTDIKFSSLDLSLKGILPVKQQFDLFAKAGVGFNITQIGSGLTETGKSKRAVKVGSALSVGASYALSTNWVADVSWNRLQATNQVKNLNFLALGISYHFVDKYCCQFLCD